MKLTLKHEDGETIAFEAEITKSPMGDEFDGNFFDEKILPEISLGLLHVWRRGAAWVR